MPSSDHPPARWFASAARLGAVALLLTGFLCTCDRAQRTPDVGERTPGVRQPLAYATGFSIDRYANYVRLSVNAARPGATDTLRYYLYAGAEPPPDLPPGGLAVATPVRRVVLTSTTDLPLLEALDRTATLVGFPQPAYAASPWVAEGVAAGRIRDLGGAEQLPPGPVLAVRPDLVVGYATGADPYAALHRVGLPVVMNGSWLEAHPLGRAEWIKFVAAFYGLDEAADRVFDRIRRAYEATAARAAAAGHRPRVLAGSLYRDVWYAPGGGSYMARLFADAGLDYAWATTAQTGSLSLGLESALVEAQRAERWVLPTTATTLGALLAENPHYAALPPVTADRVYATGLPRGARRWSFFEHGSLRADLVLADLVRIGHPRLGVADSLTFYRQLSAE